MDLTQQLHTNTTYVHQSDISDQTKTSLVNQTCNLPDSTTESPTANPIDSLILPNNSTLSQLPVCHSNQLLTAAKPDNVPLDSFKNLDVSEVEAFRNLISDVSDVSVSVMVDSTQPNQTLVDIPQYVDQEQLMNYQYVGSSQIPLNQQNLQLTSSNFSQIIQPEIDQNQAKLAQHLIGDIDQCITRMVPDFSLYPPYCKCAVVEKLVAVEQIWVCNKQMYFLPQIGIIVIDNQEHAGIFYDQNKCYIALGEIMEKIMAQYESDLIQFIHRSEDVDQQIMTAQEIGFLKQRQCISEKCNYNTAVSLGMLRQMARFIVMYEGDKSDFDPRIKNIADGDYYRKILQRYVRCASCGGVVFYSTEPDEYLIMNTESSDGNEESKCFSVGFIVVGGLRFVAFKTDGRVYISLKELCMKNIFRLQGLQARLQALRQRPRLAPKVLNSYLNTPQYNVTNTMWIDIGTLRCVCCMGKCAPGLNAEVYSCFARVSFVEHIVTNIYGPDNHKDDKAVYTMDPKTFEVVMKKTTIKTKSSSECTTKSTKRSTLKSFELSSKQNIGYESPEVLNESAFRYDKPDDTGFQETKKSEKQLKRPCIVNRPNKNNETYVSKKKYSPVDSFSNNNTEKQEATSTIEENSNKATTFCVKPAEKPYKYSEGVNNGKLLTKSRKKTDLNSVKITTGNNHPVIPVNQNSTGNKSTRNRKTRKKASDVPQTTKQNQGNAEIVKTHNSMDEDETSNAVNHLVQEFVNDGEYDITETDKFTGHQSHAITPRTESRILSRIDLNGSINNVFESPLQGNVVVEMMDTNNRQPFIDSTSPLSRLYHQYEQFERSVSPEKTVSETSLQSRNEMDMPIEKSFTADVLSTHKGEESVRAHTKGDKSVTEHAIANECNTGNTKGGNSVKEQDQNILNTTNLTIERFSTSLHTTSSATNSDKYSTKSLSSPERYRCAKTVSPAKSSGTPRSSTSPVISNLYRSRSLNSPVFKKSGEIDRHHAKVKKLTEIENESQPLDLLASLAEVITDESDSQQYNSLTDINHTESCSISDENLNVHKITFSANTEEMIRDKSNVTTCKEKMCKLIKEVESHVIVDPYKDTNTGHWKVKIKLKPGAKEALPGKFIISSCKTWRLSEVLSSFE